MILFARILVCFIIGSRGRRLEGHKGLRTSARMPIRSAAAPLESDTLPAYGKLSVEGRTLGFDSMVVYHQQTKQAVNVVFSHFLFSAYSQFRVTSTSDYDSSFFHSIPPQIRGHEYCSREASESAYPLTGKLQPPSQIHLVKNTSEKMINQARSGVIRRDHGQGTRYWNIFSTFRNLQKSRLLVLLLF